MTHKTKGVTKYFRLKYTGTKLRGTRSLKNFYLSKLRAWENNTVNGRNNHNEEIWNRKNEFNEDETTQMKYTRDKQSKLQQI